MASSVARPLALRITCASPSARPAYFAGSRRASIHVRIANPRAGGKLDFDHAGSLGYRRRRRRLLLRYCDRIKCRWNVGTFTELLAPTKELAAMGSQPRERPPKLLRQAPWPRQRSAPSPLATSFGVVARARYCYQPHTMRAIRAVAYLTNALQVRRKRQGRPVQILRYLFAFCVWLGWMYLMAMINDALFAIFLGFSMIIGGIYIPPRSGRDRPEQLLSTNQ
jgi:hypothetical protein